VAFHSNFQSHQGQNTNKNISTRRKKRQKAGQRQHKGLAVQPHLCSFK